MRYMVKSMSAAEHRTLLAVLPRYCEHMRSQPGTTLVRIHGCYAIRMYGQATHFFVMDNLFRGMPPMHEVFDLKGSWVDRRATARGGKTQLDEDWPHRRHLNVSSHAAESLLRQVCADTGPTRCAE